MSPENLVSLISTSLISKWEVIKWDTDLLDPLQSANNVGISGRREGGEKGKEGGGDKTYTHTHTHTHLRRP